MVREGALERGKFFECPQCHKMIRGYFRYRKGYERVVYAEHVDWTARPGVTPPPKEQLPLMEAV